MPPETEVTDELEDELVQNDDVDASKEAEQSTQAESSTAEDVSKPEDKDTLSVVRDVVGKDREKSEAASSADSDEAGEKPGAKATTKEPDNENYSDVPFHKHPRFQDLLGRVKTLEPDAQRYKNVETFISEQGLDANEAADTLRIAGLAKTNPAAAWKELLPWVQKVAEAAGELLPADLKQMIDEGKMTPEAAIEVSRSRAQVKSTEALTAFNRQREETRQHENARTAILGAAETWESERRSRDPNFTAKLPAIQKEVLWLQAKEGKPNTPEGVRAQLQKAYEAVATVAAPAPRQRQAVRPVTGGQVNGNVRPEVTNTMDVVKQVMARRAG
jgi:hypothetical protein